MRTVRLARAARVIELASVGIDCRAIAIGPTGGPEPRTLAGRRACVAAAGALRCTRSKVDKLEQVDGKRSTEWKLSFRNPAAADKSKDTLDLFYTLPGNFIAANHTGQ